MSMDYTFFMLPLSIMEKSEKGSDAGGNFIRYNGTTIYRMHLVGSVAAMDINEESESGYLILDDTFSSVLVHFQRSFFSLFKNINRGDFVEVLGTLNFYNDSTTLQLNNIKKIDMKRYMYNKIESIKNLKRIEG